MNIYLSATAIFSIGFGLGLALGAIIYRIVTAPLTKKDRKSLKQMAESLDAFERRNRPAPPKPLHQK